MFQVQPGADLPSCYKLYRTVRLKRAQTWARVAGGGIGWLAAEGGESILDHIHQPYVGGGPAVQAL